MNRIMPLILTTVFTAIISHIAIIHFAPDFIMSRVFNTYIKESGGFNKAVHAPRPDENARRVVRPSPDMIYTICAYDLDKGSLRVTGPNNDTYVSISFFSDRTDNFFVMNDRDLGDQKSFDLVLKSDGQTVNASESLTVVTAPTTKGIILFRTLIESEEKLDHALTLQKSQHCTLL